MSTPDQDSSVQNSTDLAARAAVELALRAKMSEASKQGYAENIERFIRFRGTKSDAGGSLSPPMQEAGAGRDTSRSREPAPRPRLANSR